MIIGQTASGLPFFCVRALAFARDLWYNKEEYTAGGPECPFFNPISRSFATAI